ncbi:PREDICTED: protein FAM195A isoform X2 [Wasmannia auropunctata]|uniref:protein FAM195A isoform X2 n=1 Tax=Wasmannia auropunctata TaxID=64793 RepID=UPI0005ED68AB|nr:PREDICTED: protein FAM195A isoform X2 [Wasmannia auropunctata]
MYTVSKGPSKIVAKTRRGISQNLERLETLRDLTRKADIEDDDEITCHVPKPVFHVNGKSKFISQRHQMQQVIITPQHEELVKFIYECPNDSIVYYDDGEKNDSLQGFKPFDLESWWGSRLYHNLLKSL